MIQQFIAVLRLGRACMRLRLKIDMVTKFLEAYRKGYVLGRRQNSI